LHALLFNRLKRRQLDIRPAGRFGYRQRIVLIGLVALSKRKTALAGMIFTWWPRRCATLAQ
jgi:hypothetical protein